MKVFNNTNITNNFKRSALAIGNFDGVHLGHQKVFERTRSEANSTRGCSRDSTDNWSTTTEFKSSEMGRGKLLV